MRIHLLENRSRQGWAVFGGYWPRGDVKTEAFALTNGSGAAVPVQSEIAARWPDGSVKWSRHIACADTLGREGMLVNRPSSPPEGLGLTETPGEWILAGRRISLRIPKDGKGLAYDCIKDGLPVFSTVYPVLSLCHEQANPGGAVKTTVRLPARIDARSVESAGPLETVFCFDGVHIEGETEKMPFRIRMSVRADGEIAFDDTFFFKGDPSYDRLSGWGLRFETALCGKSYQRHIRFLTDSVPYHDNPTQLFYWKKHLPPALLQAQMRGETVEESTELDAVASDLPRWDHFCLTQDSAQHFCIRKKAWEDGCWLDGVHGRRAPGAMALSDPVHTLLFCLRECWEKHPAGLEAENLSQENTVCTLWFYAPQAEPFDFRHYDQRTYPLGNYEGFDYMRPDPNGIAVTCHARIQCEKGYITDGDLALYALSARRPPVYCAEPEYYHRTRAFGLWSLPGEGSEVQRWVEGQLWAAFDFYEKEVEQRSWYGLFNYGDLMHTYEAARHMWRYDVGGYAWDNTELVPTLWLWYMFLRTGSERVFRLAEALSRHAADVDMYHFGPMRGLGSRHNVRHWGCPCKEPRVSMAGHHRPLYYLTGDRRIGDCLFDSLSAADSLCAMPWYNCGGGHVHLRSGPDWAALLSDWMCAYERTLDPIWRQKIENGIADLAKTPLGLTSGPDFIFDPQTGHLTYTGEAHDGSMHLQACMGGPEVWLETADMLDNEALRQMVARNGQYFFLSPEERDRSSGGLLGGRQFGSPIYSAEMQAWAAREYKDAAMAKQIWFNLISLLYSSEKPEGFKPVPCITCDDGTFLTEIPWLTTNFTAQWCLKAIVVSEIIGSSAPETLEEVEEELRRHPREWRLYGA